MKYDPHMVQNIYNNYINDRITELQVLVRGGSLWSVHPSCSWRKRWKVWEQSGTVGLLWREGGGGGRAWDRRIGKENKTQLQDIPRLERRERESPGKSRFDWEPSGACGPRAGEQEPRSMLGNPDWVKNHGESRQLWREVNSTFWRGPDCFCSRDTNIWTQSSDLIHVTSSFDFNVLYDQF